MLRQPPALRRTLLGLLAGLSTAAAAAAPPIATAGLSTWSSLPGLDAAAGASWVRAYAFDLPTTIYAGTEGSGVYRSTTGGLSWSPFRDGLMDVPGGRNVRTIHVSGSTVLVGTTAGLFRSTGGTFAPLAQGPEPDPRDPIRLPKAVQKLLPVGGRLLAGVESGGVYLSANDGETWKPPAPGNGMPRSTTVWDLATLIPGVVFAATSDGIFRSADSGTTWTPASDGISATVMRVFRDPVNPNVFYAGTLNGVFRSTTLGLTWTAVNGAGGHELGNRTVRGLVPLVNGGHTRLYAATASGLWTGTTGNGPLPGPVRWRKVTDGGLAVGGSPNRIFWALAEHALPAGTLFAGTQSNGGYALTFQPPVSVVPPSISGTVRVGQRLTATSGTWSGTDTIEHAYRWQRCTSSQASSCSDIADETSSDYLVRASDLAAPAKRFRVVVKAENDFPTLGLIERASSLTAVTEAAQEPQLMPGATQLGAPTLTVDPPGTTTLPQAGHTLRAGPGIFNPAATLRTYNWSSCNPSGSDCRPIEGAAGETYALRDEDVGRTVRVTVTGRNAHGSATTPTSVASFVVLAPHPAMTSSPRVVGVPQVGETLVGQVGQWTYAGTTYQRRWMRCDGDGNGCQTILGHTAPAYVPTADDLGRRIKHEVAADANGPNVFPPPVLASSAPTSPVAAAPPALPDPPADPPTPPGVVPGNPFGPPPAATPVPPTPRAAPPRDTTRPRLGTVSLQHAATRRGRTVRLRLTPTERVTLTVTVERCRGAATRKRPCPKPKAAGRLLRRAVGPGTQRVQLPSKVGRRVLAVGRYRVVVQATDAVGNRSVPVRLPWRVTR